MSFVWSLNFGLRALPRFLGGMVLFCACATALAAGPSLTFNRDIRPILSDHCFNCHGQDDQARKGGLRLDQREAALKGGKSGQPAIVPGKPEESELIKRLTTHDPDDLMPPAEAKNPVSSEKLEKLTRWIAEGAEYQGHWAFLPPSLPELPKISEEWREATKHFPLRSPIDAFVLARLEQEQVKPSPSAAPEILCRRLYLDLIGLPPSIEQIDAFVRDYKENPDKACARLVDELLASPGFGEKWGRWWLDAARYADTDGYEKDLPRQQWTWRDWVIHALNADMPYNRFVVEQIAGDLLPNASQEQRIATGFLRNSMVNEEGAIIAEQFRLEAMFDRMDAIGKSVLGLTLQCAQCHTHKYDPITHEEYFRIFAFLNDTYEATSWVYTKAHQKSIRALERQIAKQEQDLKSKNPDWSERLAKWEEEVRGFEIEWTPVDALEQEWVGGLAHPEKTADKSILTLGFRPTTGELWVSAMTHETNFTGLRLEALTHGDLPYGGPGRSFKGSFALSELYLEAGPISAVGANTNHAAEIKSGLVKIPLTNAVADFALPDQPIDPAFKKGNDDKRRVGPATYLIDNSDDTAWSADLGPGRRHRDSQVVMRFATNGWASAEGTFLKFWLKFRHGGQDAHGRDNAFLGRFRISLTKDENPERLVVPEEIRSIVSKPREERTSTEQGKLFSYWRTTVPEYKSWNDQIEALWKQYPEGNSVLNVAQRSPEFRRETFILDRGDWQKPTTQVQPGVPAFLHPLKSEGDPDRLDFAQWLVDPRSPTTARVLVNRVWQSLFGLGLLETADDFGVRAPLPTHPELLDWLSVEFMNPSQGSAWSLKTLLRQILLSSTYAQSSRISPELQERDPNNLLLARAPRFRVEAETIRDLALSASGLLHQKIGGPSFYPPVPQSLFALNYLKIDWKTADAPERYRRSLYVFRRRSMPDPIMSAFDAPSGEVSCVRRARSNTPLAALTSLNEPLFYEAAQSLALRVLRECSASERERAIYAFRLCASRPPRDGEISIMLDFLESRKKRLAEGWIPAKEIAFTDQSLPNLPPGVTPTDAAAWTILSRVLLNLDETLSKN